MDQRDRKIIEKGFYEQAILLKPFIDFFYLDVLCGSKECEIALSVTEKLNLPVLVGLHVKRNGKLRLKETYWYEMYTEYEGELVPEAKEGIKKAKWKNFKKSQKALKKSYANIKMLFPEKFLAGKSEDWVA